MTLKRIEYHALDSRQQENYNFAKLSGLLADYGFTCFRMTSDWNGADLVAVHISDPPRLVQLKGRLTFSKSYRGKNLWIAFCERSTWYLYPHDELLVQIESRLVHTSSWEKGTYHWPSIPEWGHPILQPWVVGTSQVLE